MDKKKIFFDAVVNNFIDVRTSISNVGYFFLPSCSVVIKSNHKIDTHKGEEFEHVRLTLNDLEKWTKPRFGSIFKNDYGITNEEDIFEVERMVVDKLKPKLRYCEENLDQLLAINESVNREEKIREYFKSKIYRHLHNIWEDHYKEHMTFWEALESDISELKDFQLMIETSPYQVKEEVDSDRILNELVNHWGFDMSTAFDIYISLTEEIHEEEMEKLNETKNTIKSVLKEETNKVERFKNFIRDDIFNKFDAKTIGNQYIHFGEVKARCYAIFQYIKETYNPPEIVTKELVTEWFYEKFAGGMLPRIGDRIVVTHIEGDEPYVKEGDEGEVMDISGGYRDEVQIYVKFDTGHHLNLLYSVEDRPIDEWDVIERSNELITPAEISRHMFYEKIKSRR
jgi:hypothetical protein